MKRLQKYWIWGRYLVKHLGWKYAPRYRASLKRLFHANAGVPISFQTRNLLFPVYCRAHTSDLSVFEQIFLDRQYAALVQYDKENIGLVLDCGANAGFSAAYFLSAFPNAVVICVEPDPDNFIMLQRNVRPYGKRAICLQAGIWSCRTELKLLHPPQQDGKEWAVQVRPCKEEETSEVQAFSIPDILKQLGMDDFPIDILKMDIEGAEGIVFASGYETWLSRVRRIAVEIHDIPAYGNCRKNVFNAITSCTSLQPRESGEITFFEPVAE